MTGMTGMTGLRKRGEHNRAAFICTKFPSHAHERRHRATLTSVCEEGEESASVGELFVAGCQGENKVQQDSCEHRIFHGTKLKALDTRSGHRAWRPLRLRTQLCHDTNSPRNVLCAACRTGSQSMVHSERKLQLWREGGVFSGPEQERGGADLPRRRTLH